MSNVDLRLCLALPTPNMDYCVKNKRCFEQAFGNFTEEYCNTRMPLLLWSTGHPNEEDDQRDQKKRTSTIDDGEEDQIVGWPPIKSWRKKTILHQKVDSKIKNKGSARNENGGSIYVKVKMEGVAIARKIDIRLYHSYQQLTKSMITMFSKNKKCDLDDYTRYTLTYQDKEGDWLIAGDIPWQIFIRNVQRLKILSNWGLNPTINSSKFCKIKCET